ncbi:MAG: tetratricopeptide repeat protein [Myxococcota bacterium]
MLEGVEDLEGENVEGAGVTAGSNKALAAVALGLAVLTVAVYLPVLDNGFVKYDDDLYILNNSHVNQGLGVDSVRWAFTTFRGANWFPLTWISWATDFSIFGPDPRGFHLTSLVLHVANAVLLLLALARLTGAPWRSAFVAAVFAVHPLHVESVAWAAARTDVLSGLFAMLALLAYERSVRRGRAFQPAVLLFLTLGLMSKPTLVTWPFVLLLLDFWPLARLTREGAPGRIDFGCLRRAVFEKLPLFGVAAIAGAIAFASQSEWGTVQALDRLSLWARIENALMSTVLYLVDAFRPVGLTVFYPHPGDSIPFWMAAAAGGLLLYLTMRALRLYREHPDAVVGWLWFIGSLVPVIGLVQVGQAARADRYMYLPLIGLSLPLAFAATSFVRRWPWARGVAVAAAVGALSVAANAQVRRWHDSITLFQHANAVTEDNHVADINLGIAYFNRQQYRTAALHLERALRVAPHSATAAGALADVRVAENRAEEGLRLYRRARQSEPDTVRWREGEANALIELGRADEALPIYEALLEDGRERAHTYAGHALALSKLGRDEEAVASFERALAINPMLDRVHGNFALTLIAVGREQQAIAHFERAIELNPRLAIVRAHYGNLLAERRQYPPALVQLQEAVRLEPANPQYHTALALALDGSGDRQQAIVHHRKALTLDPHDVASLFGLSHALLLEGRSPEALPLAEEAVRATGRRVAPILSLLADIHAAEGSYDAAIRLTEEAMVLAEASGNAQHQRVFRMRLDAYRAGRRY